MEDSQPHKSMLPKAPIPVEESRAQRLQRSQARFRDRGGIFVPTARNTLVDILLGRKVASPKKGRGRSASLSPKKKSTKGGLRHNDEEVKVLRTSPRKAAQRQEPEAGPSSFGDMIMKHKKTKTSEKAKPATASSGAKNLVDTEKPLTKKRGRKPKAVVQEVEPPNTSVDPPPPAKSQSTLKKPRTKSASKKPASLAGSKKNSSIEGPSISGPNKSAKTTSKTELDPVMKKSSCTSTSTASKRKPPASIKSEPAPLQQSSTGIGSSKIKKAPVSDDDRRINEVHQESSREIAFNEKKGKKKAPETTNPLDMRLVEVLPKTRKKRARPAESECPSPQKRAKQTPSEETKSRPRRKKAPTAQKDTTMSMQETVETKNKDPLSKSPPSKKRARGPDDGRPGAKRKKTKGTMDITVPDETVKKQANGSKGKAEKTKKPPASKTSRTKAVTTKASKQDKAQAPAETDTESGALIIPRIRPRKSVIIRMKEPDPHQRVDNDPDPIDFLG